MKFPNEPPTDTVVTDINQQNGHYNYITVYFDTQQTAKTYQDRYKGKPFSEAETNQLQGAVEEVLKEEPCRNFITAVLEKLGQTTGKKAHSSNILDIFKEVRKQGGFGRDLDMKDSAVGGSTVGNKDAFVTLKLIKILENPRGQNDIGRKVIHELFHVASSTNQYYSHWEMYKAGYEVAKVQGLPLGVKPADKDLEEETRLMGVGLRTLFFTFVAIRVR